MKRGNNYTGARWAFSDKSRKPSKKSKPLWTASGSSRSPKSYPVPRKFRIQLAAKVTTTRGEIYTRQFPALTIEAENRDIAVDDYLGQTIPENAEDFNVKMEDIQEVRA